MIHGFFCLVYSMYYYIHTTWPTTDASARTASEITMRKWNHFILISFLFLFSSWISSGAHRFLSIGFVFCCFCCFVFHLMMGVVTVYNNTDERVPTFYRHGERKVIRFNQDGPTRKRRFRILVHSTSKQDLSISFRSWSSSFIYSPHPSSIYLSIDNNKNEIQALLPFFFFIMCCAAPACQ